MQCLTGVIDWRADRRKFSSDCMVKHKDFPHKVFMSHSARQPSNKHNHVRYTAVHDHVCNYVQRGMTTQAETEDPPAKMSISAWKQLFSRPKACSMPLADSMYRCGRRKAEKSFSAASSDFGVL